MKRRLWRDQQRTCQALEQGNRAVGVVAGQCGDRAVWRQGSVATIPSPAVPLFPEMVHCDNNFCAEEAIDPSFGRELKGSSHMAGPGSSRAGVCLE